jgi:hypothetical protein
MPNLQIFQYDPQLTIVPSVEPTEVPTVTYYPTTTAAPSAELISSPTIEPQHASDQSSNATGAMTVSFVILGLALGLTAAAFVVFWVIVPNYCKPDDEEEDVKVSSSVPNPMVNHAENASSDAVIDDQL